MANCHSPFIVKQKLKADIPVPCGKCPDCRKRRVSGWAFRLTQEDKRSWNALFVTLTYDTSYVPITPKGYLTVKKKDVQDFFKRLRKSMPKQAPKIKYYAAAEYGGKTNRPHYHAIIFNALASDIEKAWMRGVVHYGSVTGASIGYTLKYMDKPSRIPMHRNDDRSKEFALMSKHLGENYLTASIRSYHLADMLNRSCLRTLQGHVIAMPRYYKLKIFDEFQQKRIAHFAKYQHEKDTIKSQNFYSNLGLCYESVKAASNIASYANWSNNFKKDKT